MVAARKEMRRTSSSSTSRVNRKKRRLHLIDPKDGAEILPDRRVYTDADMSPWRIEVVMDDPVTPEFMASFQDVFDEHDDMTGIDFILSLPQTSLYSFKVRIWHTKEIEYESHVPVMVSINTRKKLLCITMLAKVRQVPEGVEVVYKE